MEKKPKMPLEFKFFPITTNFRCLELVNVGKKNPSYSLAFFFSIFLKIKMLKAPRRSEHELKIFGQKKVELELGCVKFAWLSLSLVIFFPSLNNSWCRKLLNDGKKILSCNIDFLFFGHIRTTMALRVAKRWLARTWVAPYVLLFSLSCLFFCFFVLWASNNILVQAQMWWKKKRSSLSLVTWFCVVKFKPDIVSSSLNNFWCWEGLVVTHLSYKLGPKLDPNSSSGVFCFWKVSNSWCQKLLIFGGEKPKLMLNSKIRPK